MADRRPEPDQTTHLSAGGGRVLTSPTSSRLVGVLTLLVAGGILLLLTGLTVTTGILVLIFFSPLIILLSPIWIPVLAVSAVAILGFVSASAFGIAVVSGAAWVYRYVMGRHPVGSDRVDYARSRIVDTASHVKDYAREYSGYLRNRVKDAAPGA